MASFAAGGETRIESHAKIDRTYGIGRDVGFAWFEAARHGDLNTLKSLLSKNDKLVHYNGQGTTYGLMGHTALHWAAANGDLPMMRLLMSKGAAINIQNNGGSTALHSACANGQVNAVRLLLERGGSPHIVDCCTDTPRDVLHSGHAAIIGPLLAGFDIAQRLGNTPKSAWGVADMKQLVKIIEPRSHALERDELAARVEQVLEHYRAQSRSAAAADAVTRRIHDTVEAHRAQRVEEEGLDEDEVQRVLEVKDKGNKAFQDGDMKAAIRYYTLAIKMVGGSHADVTAQVHVLFSNRCACYLKIGQPNKALQDAQECLRASGGSWPKAFHRLGSALFGLGRYDEAMAAFRKGLHLLPGDTALQDGMQRSREAMLGRGDSSDESSSEDEQLSAAQEAQLMEMVRQRAEAAAAPAIPRASSSSFTQSGGKKPWFDCVLCENKTRDHATTPCCGKQICGTCLNRKCAAGCPFGC